MVRRRQLKRSSLSEAMTKKGRQIFFQEKIGRHPSVAAPRDTILVSLGRHGVARLFAALLTGVTLPLPLQLANSSCSPVQRAIKCVDCVKYTVGSLGFSADC